MRKKRAVKLILSIMFTVIVTGQLALTNAGSNTPLALTKLVSASTVTIDSVEYSQDVKKALDHLNKRRAEAGLKPVKLDPILTKAAQGHADYLAINNENGHTQSKNKKGFTGVSLSDRVKAAGEASSNSYTILEVIAYLNTVEHSIDNLLAVPYHRVALIDANAEFVGFGVKTSSNGRMVLVADFYSKGTDSTGRTYPYDGQINVPTTMNKGEEIPDPVAEVGLEKSGFILTYTYFGDVKKLTPNLKDSKGNSVSLLTKLDTAPSVTEPALLTGRTLLIIPKTELKPNEKYTLEVDGKSSTFTTNERSGSFVDVLYRTPVIPTSTPKPSKQPITVEKAPRKFSAEDVGIQLDGKYIDVKPRARVINGSTYIPLRGVLEAMGVKVTYNKEEGKLYYRTLTGKREFESYTGIVNLTNENTSIDLYIGTTRVDIQGTPSTLSAKPFVESGTTYVPLRFISETLGTAVQWDGKNYTVIITTD